MRQLCTYSNDRCISLLFSKYVDYIRECQKVYVKWNQIIGLLQCKKSNFKQMRALQEVFWKCVL